MRNLKIGARIAVWFGLLVLLLIGVGLFSLDRMRHLEQSTETLAHLQFAKVRLAESGIQHVNANARGALHMFLMTDLKEREEALAVQKEQSAEINRIYSDFEKTLLIDRERDLFAKVTAARQNYTVERGKAERILADGNREQALTALERSVLPGLAEYIKAWDLLLTVEGEMANATATDAIDEYGAARSAIAMVLLVSVLLGVCKWSVRLTRSPSAT
jgi:methyl-accepting chemotaxis protein